MSKEERIQQVNTFVGLIGSISTFNPNLDEWDVYVRRLKQFFLANEINENKQKSILLTSLHQDAYMLLIDLCLPEEPENVSFDQLIKILDTHYREEVALFAERQLFYEAFMEDTETIAEWAARLRRLAAKCKFGEQLENALKDRFVIGMRKGKVKERLFLEDPTKITFEKALCKAKSEFAAEKGQKINVKQEVFAVERRSCLVCGYSNHSTQQCRYKNYECSLCHIKGHLRRVCKAKNVKEPRHQRYSSKSFNYVDNSVQEEQTSENRVVPRSSPLSSEFLLNYVDNDERIPPVEINITVQGIPIKAQIDTGASLCAMSDSTYFQYFKDVKLLESKDILHYYSAGMTVKPLGRCALDVLYNGQSRTVTFHVVANGGGVILGRNFLSSFSFKVHQVYAVQQSSEVRAMLRKCFPEVYNNKLGKFNKFKIAFRVKPGTIPQMFKPRRLPYALKAKVEEEIERLLTEGIISPIEYSQWGTPIVPVVKPDGSVRLCGDYRLTLNPFLEIDRHPIPRVEDLFTDLQGAQYFSKIDLKAAFQQVELTDDSKEFTTIVTHKGSPTDRSSSRPQFSTEGRHFKVVEHNSVVLPCRVVNIGSHVRAWKRGIAVLTAGQVKVSPDERYRLVHGYDLEVQDVGPADEGEYTCQIATLTPQEVTHTLEILVPPKIEEVSGGGLVEARAGSQVTIDCRASGNPPPFLQWTRKTNRTLPGLKPMNGSSLLLGSVSRHQAGLYQCVASNGVGRPAFAELKLRVLYPPEVETEEPWVHTGVGSQAVLVCTVYAEPQAEVRWYRSALKLEVTDDHETERRGNRHRLIIRRVEAQDLDNYTCEAVNNLGKAKQSILLSGRPRAAVFRSGPLSRWRDSYNISWSVFSQSQLLEHRLFYRRRLIGGQLPSALLPERWGMNMSAWYGRDWTEVILQASYTDSVTQDMSYLITGLQPATQYEAKVKASNSFGWSQTSEAFLFTTRGLDGFSWESSQGSEEVILTPEKEIRDLGVILEDYSNSRSSISGIKYIYLDAALLLLMAYQNLELYL